MTKAPDPPIPGGHSLAWIEQCLRMAGSYEGHEEADRSDTGGIRGLLDPEPENRLGSGASRDADAAASSRSEGG